MLINRLAALAALIVALIGLAKAFDAVEFLDGRLEGGEECRQQNNISREEYEKFLEFENLENVLNETVELKYKCHVKCLMETQIKKLLNDQGKLDLKQMNVTSKETEEITKCMEQANEEPCSFAFKLVVCTFKFSAPDFNYFDALEEYVDSSDEEEFLELTTELGQ